MVLSGPAVSQWASNLRQSVVLGYPKATAVSPNALEGATSFSTTPRALHIGSSLPTKKSDPLFKMMLGRSYFQFRYIYHVNSQSKELKLQFGLFFLAQVGSCTFAKRQGNYL